MQTTSHTSKIFLAQLPLNSSEWHQIKRTCISFATHGIGISYEIYLPKLDGTSGIDQSYGTKLLDQLTDWASHLALNMHRGIPTIASSSQIKEIAKSIQSSLTSSLIARVRQFLGTLLRSQPQFILTCWNDPANLEIRCLIHSREEARFFRRRISCISTPLALIVMRPTII